MLKRCGVFVLALVLSSPAAAVDPFVLFLLRMARDRAISASIERGVDAMRQDSAPQAPAFGYAMPTEAVPQGGEEQRIRTVIDESFLHLNAAQRDEVFASMRRILNDPQHAGNKSMIVAEFTIAASAVRESYRLLDRLSNADKRRLVAQAKGEFARLPPGERKQMLDALSAGTLPVPRDLSSIMLAEFGGIAP